MDYGDAVLALTAVAVAFGVVLIAIATVGPKAQHPKGS